MGRAYAVRKASIEKTGAAKAKVYTFYAKEIYSAAKKGGTSPESNAVLKRLLEKAKKDQVPTDIIKRAIDKVKSGVDENYENLRYEVFGPGASTVIIECLTDNVNRTIGYVRGALSKGRAKMGATNSVTYMYDHLCVVSFKGLSEEETLDILLNAGLDVDDIESTDDLITVYGNPNDLYKIKDALTAHKPDLNFETDEVTMIPHEMVKLEGEDLEFFHRLIDHLDEIDDVQEVYHNVILD